MPVTTVRGVPMKSTKSLLVFGLCLFGLIAVVAVFKKKDSDTNPFNPGPIEISLDIDTPSPAFATSPATANNTAETEGTNRIAMLFNTSEPKLPFVETIRYSSKVPWLSGRPAWIVDYANHFDTTRHFIARSLNGAPNYMKQDVRNGDHFNVLRSDKDIQFRLVVDIETSHMRFYAYEGNQNERTLLKTYLVGLGRLTNETTSGSLTPMGQYELGKRVAVYKPKMYGPYLGKKTEMVQVFGSRWIPFERAVANNTAPAKGYGIHGVPWDYDEETKKFKQRNESIGKYESDGCIRMKTDDVEELYAIIVTKPTVIDIVKSFDDAKLPGAEATY
jgi:lipoprotein-anchoring transpeptidase ErfK/SrfK